jgi:DNA repair exonuclease SbcCD nuclease subunit
VVRVVVTAENHLSAYTPRLSPAKLAVCRRRLSEAFKQVVDYAIKREAHLFLHAGDLFDSIEPRNQERDFVAQQLVRMQSKGIRVFAVSGNHDTPRQRTEQGGVSPQGVYHQLHGMHYFALPHVLQPHLVEVNGLRLAIAGLSSTPGASPGSDPLDGVTVEDPDKLLETADLGLLMVHAAIEGHGFPGEAETFIRRRSLDKLAGFHVVVTGHVHAFARFSVGKKAVVVCGATEFMGFDHAKDSAGFAFLELRRGGLQSARHIPIPRQPRRVVTMTTAELWPRHRSASDSADNQAALADGEASLTNAVPVLSPAETIERRLKRYCTEESMVRLVLEGPLTREQYHALDLQAVWTYGQQHAFSFEVDESRLVLTTERAEAHIVRGERIGMREMLEHVSQDFMERAETPEARALLAKTRQRVLECYDALAGGEVNR